MEIQIIGKGVKLSESSAISLLNFITTLNNNDGIEVTIKGINYEIDESRFDEIED